ncbi:MAG: phosphatidylglycerophosphatase A, partial [Terriglobales bacterium]
MRLFKWHWAKAPAPQVMKQRGAFLLATWFGCGRSPFAPGTAGSAAALAIGIALHRYAGFSGWHFLLLAAALFYPAVWAAGVAARVSKIEDPGFV